MNTISSIHEAKKLWGTRHASKHALAGRIRTSVNAASVKQEKPRERATVHRFSSFKLVVAF
jgi:hypothetical protein